MKKSLLAIMLVALALTVGLMVSCVSDPDPDALYGSWTYTSGYDATNLMFDGYGGYRLVRTYHNAEYYREEGTYKCEDGYISLKGTRAPKYTETNPNYIFIYNEGETTTSHSIRTTAHTRIRLDTKESSPRLGIRTSARKAMSPNQA